MVTSVMILEHVFQRKMMLRMFSLLFVLLTDQFTADLTDVKTIESCCVRVSLMKVKHKA